MNAYPQYTTNRILDQPIAIDRARIVSAAADLLGWLMRDAEQRRAARVLVIEAALADAGYAVQAPGRRTVRRAA